MKTTTHSEENLKWIDTELRKLGVADYRFYPENDCYVCDRNGNFFSVCHRQMSKAGNIIERYEIRKLRGSIDKYGYMTYRVVVKGEKKHLKAHRMMLVAWVGDMPGLVVNHKDGDKRNNALANLEWCTVAENNAHAIATGLFDPHAIKQEYAIPPADWMAIYVLNRHFGVSQCELGRMNGCCHTTIAKIIERISRVLPQEVRDGA